MSLWSGVMFSKIIANPPFLKRAVSSKLFPLLPSICEQAAVLFPTSFAFNLGIGDPKCRESWNHFIDKIDYIGPNVFKKTDVDVSLYFCKHSEEDKMHVFSDFEKKLYPLGSIIKEKCLHAKEHILKEWLGDPRAKEGPQERKEYRKWIQSRIENGEVFLNGSIFCRNYADGLVLRKVSGGLLIGFQGPKAVAEELKKEIYKGLAYVFSTNKRDVSGCHLVKIPIFCENIFTEEEKEYLLKLSRGSKEH